MISFTLFRIYTFLSPSLSFSLYVYISILTRTPTSIKFVVSSNWNCKYLQPSPPYIFSCQFNARAYSLDMFLFYFLLSLSLAHSIHEQCSPILAFSFTLNYCSRSPRNILTLSLSAAVTASSPPTARKTALSRPTASRARDNINFRRPIYKTLIRKKQSLPSDSGAARNFLPPQSAP